MNGMNETREGREMETGDEIVERIAVIGSGLAGLTAAYLLGKEGRGWEIHVFEKADKFGVDAASVDVSVVEDGQTLDVAIDVPMRSIDAGYYPRLLRLLNELDVAVRPDDLTFAFSDEKTRIPYLIYNGLSGIQGLSVTSTKSYLTAFFQIVYYSIGFIYLCILSLLHYHLRIFPRIQKMTFEEFCIYYSIPPKFWRDVLVPLYSGVCTCKESDVLNYPAGLLVDYIGAVFGTRHYTIASPQGFRVVVNALTSSIPKSQTHTSTTITSISGFPSAYTLHSATSTFGPFQHVIFATPPHISSKILRTLPSHCPEISANLNIFKYVPSLVITHTDPTFIPSSPSLHRDLHFQRPSTPISPLQKLTNYTQATHILHHRSPHLKSLQVYQTTNPSRYPQKESILSQTWFERYLPTLESLKIRKEMFGRNGWAQGTDNMWFVGSHIGEGVPLLEGCVESAQMVVEMLLEREEVKAKWTTSWCGDLRV